MTRSYFTVKGYAEFALGVTRPFAVLRLPLDWSSLKLEGVLTQQIWKLKKIQGVDKMDYKLRMNVSVGIRKITFMKLLNAADY